MRRSQRFVSLATAAWLAAGLLPAAAGPTASSYLRFLEVQRNGRSGVAGLNGATGVALSPDGRQLYAAGELDDTLAVFDRDSATGALMFVEVQKDGTGDVTGLKGAHGVVVSPDGANVYVASKIGDALAVFSRDAETGRLTFVQSKRDNVGGVNGLNGAEGIAISPDGADVYVAGRNDNALAVFSRDAADGVLTFVEIQRDGLAGVSGLQGTKAVAVSSDGAHVYAAGSLDNEVAVFGRDAATGKLTFIEVQSEGQNGVTGLTRARALNLSPDGANLYVAGGYDDALAVFSRDAETGKLTFEQLLEDSVDGVNGLNGADAVTVSPDGTHVYVTGSVDDALAVFQRDTTSGMLTFVERLRDNTSGIDGLNSAAAVTVSADNRNVYAAGYVDDAVSVFRVRGCGDGVLDPGEECDDGNLQDGDCCSSTCGFEPATTLCHPAAGPCDVADFCTGSSATCPNQFAPATLECRGALGRCDVAEFCTGTGSACPADGFRPATAVCRPAAGVCDIGETCTGTGPSCPEDRKSTAICRPAAGACDVADRCDGVGNDCPADAVAPATVECRPATGPCDAAETCDGRTAVCPANALKPAGVPCGVGSDPCALQSSCSGASAACPTAPPKVGLAAVLCAFDRSLGAGACSGQSTPAVVQHLFVQARALIVQANGAPDVQKKRRLRQARALLKKASKAIVRSERRKQAPLSPSCATLTKAMISDALGRVTAVAK